MQAFGLDEGTMSKEKRKVYIEEERGWFLVRFLERKKGQRYLAAGFDKSMRDRAGVEQWIAESGKFELASIPNR